MQISNARGSTIPEQILMKPKIYNYVAGMTTDANPSGAATTWVVSANTCPVTCFRFLGDPFLSLYLASRCAIAVETSCHCRATSGL